MQAPKFEVDPFWPKPLPNHWLLGSTIGVWVDAQDHVWIIHRSSATLNSNEKGAELNPRPASAARARRRSSSSTGGQPGSSWGGPGQGYRVADVEPRHHRRSQGQRLDRRQRRRRLARPEVHEGRQVPRAVRQAERARTGRPNATGDPTYASATATIPSNFGRVAKIFVDPKANEAYIADGYFNKRVAVLDADTGKMKRYWGAYGNKPDDTNLGPYNPDAPPAQQFRNPVHCADLSNDGLCTSATARTTASRSSQQDGKFVKEAFFAKRTPRRGVGVGHRVLQGPAAALHLPRGRPQHEGLHPAARHAQELTSFGDGGRQPGQFFGVHSVATDSKGNLYTTETYEGKRVQKFVYRGLAPVRSPSQGVLWPRTE